MTRFNLFTLSWRELIPSVRPIIPPVSFGDHKGTMGRIGIVGGSADYTGAPFYAAVSALKFGADLSFVFCSREAAVPIKSYSPELMVTSFYDDSSLVDAYDPSTAQGEILRATHKVKESLSRLHTLVIGPGLGRNENVLRAVRGIIEEAKAKSLHMIIDADGLFLLSNDPLLFHGYTRCIITPNKVEFDRLADSMIQVLRNTTGIDPPTIEALVTELSSEDEAIRTRALSLSLGGLTVYRKGELDMITAGGDVYIVNEKGSPRRCGGQGDILSGCLGVGYYWASKLNPNELLNSSQNLSRTFQSLREVQSILDLNIVAEAFPAIPANERIILRKSIASVTGNPQLAPSGTVLPSTASLDRISAILGAALAGPMVKKASEIAFLKHGRSMTAPDVIECLGMAFQTSTEN